MISLEMYLKGRDKQFPREYTPEIEKNANRLLQALNSFLDELGVTQVTVTSGWRSKTVNEATSNSAALSKHLTGEAIDLFDPDGNLCKLVINNLDKAVKYGLYFEDFRWTPNWVHIQNQPPKSGRRIYIPSTKPAISPDKWDGNYDKKYNS